MKNIMMITVLVLTALNVQAAPAILGKWSADFIYMNNTYSMTLDIQEEQTTAVLKCSDGSQTLTNSLTAASNATDTTYTVLESKSNPMVQGELDCSLSIDGAVESTYKVEGDTLTLVTDGLESVLTRVK